MAYFNLIQNKGVFKVEIFFYGKTYLYPFLLYFLESILINLYNLLTNLIKLTFVEEDVIKLFDLKANELSHQPCSFS